MFGLFKRKHKNNLLSGIDMEEFRKSLHDPKIANEYYSENHNNFLDIDNLEKKYKEDALTHIVENEISTSIAVVYALIQRVSYFYPQISKRFDYPEFPIEKFNQINSLYAKMLMLVKTIRPLMSKEMWDEIHDPTYALILAITDIFLERNIELEKRYGDKLYTVTTNYDIINEVGDSGTSLITGFANLEKDLLDNEFIKEANDTIFKRWFAFGECLDLVNYDDKFFYKKDMKIITI